MTLNRLLTCIDGGRNHGTLLCDIVRLKERIVKTAVNWTLSGPYLTAVPDIARGGQTVVPIGVKVKTVGSELKETYASERSDLDPTPRPG